jgi:hypothetical protein
VRQVRSWCGFCLCCNKNDGKRSHRCELGFPGVRCAGQPLGWWAHVPFIVKAKAIGRLCQVADRNPNYLAFCLNSARYRTSNTRSNRPVWDAARSYSLCIHRRIDTSRWASFLLRVILNWGSKYRFRHDLHGFSLGLSANDLR